ncbi:hypothetical protein [Motiliproteus sp. SC1-56]|uniref:hypothetical protein n=1 Tax=Motiliproteus sp. SC1-56 TaxID=2799565 RepID=UPI001A8E86A1|nr:hypothetical protein [Motiliproteus sp. SC1-56]
MKSQLGISAILTASFTLSLLASPALSTEHAKGVGESTDMNSNPATLTEIKLAGINIQGKIQSEFGPNRSDIENAFGDEICEINDIPVFMGLEDWVTLGIERQLKPKYGEDFELGDGLRRDEISIRSREDNINYYAKFAKNRRIKCSLINPENYLIIKTESDQLRKFRSSSFSHKVLNKLGSSSIAAVDLCFSSRSGQITHLSIKQTVADWGSKANTFDNVLKTYQEIWPSAKRENSRFIFKNGAVCKVSNQTTGFHTECYSGFGNPDPDLVDIQYGQWIALMLKEEPQFKDFIDQIEKETIGLSIEQSEINRASRVAKNKTNEPVY